MKSNVDNCTHTSWTEEYLDGYKTGYIEGYEAGIVDTVKELRKKLWE